MRFWSLLFKKQVLPIKDALHCVHAAQAIMLRLCDTPGYQPEEEDFILLTRLQDEAQDLRLLAMRALHQLHARAAGEPRPPAP